MDSLMAALVAALLIRVTDRSAGWVAYAAETSKRTGAILTVSVIAMIVTYGIAATAGSIVGRYLTPNPKQLMLGLMLVLAAVGAVWPGKIKEPRLRHPAIDTGVYLISTGLSGRGEYVTFALALGGVPALAAVGGGLGSIVVLGFAAVAGDTLWRSFPHRAIGWVIGPVLAIAGIWLCLSALRLI